MVIFEPPKHMREPPNDELAVKFQKVVHSVSAEEAEVAETSVIPRRTE
jgi:hypothetical protein